MARSDFSAPDLGERRGQAKVGAGHNGLRTTNTAPMIHRAGPARSAVHFGVMARAIQPVIQSEIALGNRWTITAKVP